MNPWNTETLEWLDSCPKSADAWAILEEAARLTSMANPNDLHMAGRIYGLATALQVMNSPEASYGKGYDVHDTDAWIEFIEAFAEDNYENGRRCE